MKRVLVLFAVVLLPFVVYAQRGGKPFWHNIPALEYHGHNRNFDIVCDDSGRVYVANFEGLITWDGIDWTVVHTPGISRVTSLYRASDGRLWIGGYNIIGYPDNQQQIRYVTCDTTQTARFGEVHNIYEDEDGGIAFSSDEGRYVILDGSAKSLASSSEQGSVSASLTWKEYEVNQILAVPDQGLKAVATKTDGLIVSDNDGKILFRLSSVDGLCSDGVEALAYDGKGSLWGATNNGLFQVVLSPVFSIYGASDGLVGQVTSITSVRGKLYVGTLQGLFEMGDDGVFTKVEGLDLACWKVVPYERGILAATAQGLYRYDGTLTQLTPRHTLTIYVSTGGNIITGEVDGIYCLMCSGGEMKLSQTKNVADFQADTDGLWAINYYGETFHVGENSMAFERKDNKSLSLLLRYRDPLGRLWKSSDGNSGVVCEELDDSQKLWCRSLDAYDVETMYVDGDRAYFGGIFGLVSMDLAASSAISPYEPELQIRSLFTNDYTASFSAVLDKTDPFGTPMYSYRLHADDQWSAWSPETDVNFGRMDVGKYELSIRCKDSFGNISVSDPVQFVIQPPFYLKWYAFLLYALVLGGGAFLYFRVKLIKAQKEQERLEGLVNERTQELKDAQGQLLRQEREATVGKLTKGLIDRILNPMNYINNFSHLSIGLASDLTEDIEDEKDNMTQDSYDDCVDVCDMLKTNLGKIEQHGLATTRILKAMEELLKDRSGKVESADITAICTKNNEMLLNYYKDDISSLGIDIQLCVPSSPLMANVNTENLSKTIMSMLSNSVYAVKKKFSAQPSGEKPLIKLSAQVGENGKGCRIEVYDNGIGIESSILDKIFDPFFTTKPTGEAPGVGLYLSQQVIQDLGGSLTVDSVKDEYTKFTIILS